MFLDSKFTNQGTRILSFSLPCNLSLCAIVEANNGKQYKEALEIQQKYGNVVGSFPFLVLFEGHFHLHKINIIICFFSSSTTTTITNPYKNKLAHNLKCFFGLSHFVKT
jgi:hypothetical protein